MYWRFPWLLALAAVLCLGAAGCSKEAQRTRSLARADKYFAEQKYDEAEIEYRNTLKLQPDNLRALAQIGVIYNEQGKRFYAREFLRQALTLSPTNLEVRLRMAQNDVLNGAFPSAKTNLAVVLKSTPTNTEALLLLSKLSATAGEATGTLRFLEGLAAPMANNPLYHLAKGALFRRLTNSAAARESMTRAYTLDPKSAEVNLEMGRFFLADKDYSRAEQAFRLAAERSPLRSTLRLEEIELKIGLRKPDDAAKLLNDLIAKAPDYLPALVTRARLEFRAGRYDECARTLQLVLARDDFSWEARTSLVDVWLAKGDAAKAVAEGEKLVQTFPNSGQFRYKLARAYKAAYEADPQLAVNVVRAVSELEGALRLQPDLSEATLLLAELRMHRGETGAAITALTQLIRKQTNLVQAYFVLANAYRTQKQYQEALETYQRLTQVAPGIYQTYLDIGQTLLDIKQPQLARQAFVEAAKRATNNLQPALKLIELDVKEGKADAAIERANQLVSLYPKEAEPLIVLAKVYEQQTNFAKAEAAYLQAIAVEPQAKASYAGLARLYVDNGRTAEAIGRLEAMVKKDPQDASMTSLLAELYISNKDFDKALGKLETLVAKNPKDARVLMSMGMTYTKKGDLPKARDAYERALNINSNSFLVLNNLAQLYAGDLKDLDRGLVLARRARELVAGETNNLVVGAAADSLGWIHYLRGEYPYALTLIQEALQMIQRDQAESLNRWLPRDQAEVHYHLGAVYYAMGAEQPARAAIERALQLSQDFPGKADAEQRLRVLEVDVVKATKADLPQLQKLVDAQPNDLIARIKLGALLEKTGDLDKAVEVYERAYQANTNSVSVSLRLARAYAQRPKTQAQAMLLARNARRLAPNDPETGYLVGHLAQETASQPDDFNWSYGLLQESGRALPDRADIQYDLAWAAYSVGRLPEATDAMARALKLDPSLPQASKGRLFVELAPLVKDPKSLPAAAARVQEILKGDPDFVPALHIAGLLHEQRGQAKEAAQTFERIVARYPTFLPALRSLAILSSQDEGDLAKAYAIAMRVREAFPSDPDVAKALGKISYRRGDFRYAATLLQESARQRKDDADLLFHLGLAQAKQQQAKDAKDSLTRATALDPNHKLAAEAKKVLSSLK